MPLPFPPFRPHPLVRGGHLQTIVGNFFPGRSPIEAALHRVELADGDAIAVHEDRIENAQIESDRGRGTPTPRGAVLLVHGLGGCRQSGYMVRCSAKLRARGMRVFRMDLRGCGAGEGLARRPLHAGRSEDAAAALEFVHRRCPDEAIHLVGFSMGANIVLKLAGELGPDAPPYLASVMGVSPPLDLVACSSNLQRGLNRLYDRRFVRSLVRHVERQQKLLPDALYRPLAPRPRHLAEFDSRFTAPLSGFADLNDYYTRASCGPLLARIGVPALVIHAASDPIVPLEPFKQANYSPTTEIVIAPCGGHLGFIAAPGTDPDSRWLDWRVVDWVLSREAHKNR